MASVTVEVVSRFVLYIGSRVLEETRGPAPCSPSHFKYLSGVKVDLQVLCRICRGVCSGMLVGRWLVVGVTQQHFALFEEVQWESGVLNACSAACSGTHVVDQ